VEKAHSDAGKVRSRNRPSNDSDHDHDLHLFNSFDPKAVQSLLQDSRGRNAQREAAVACRVISFEDRTGQQFNAQKVRTQFFGHRIKRGAELELEREKKCQKQVTYQQVLSLSWTKE
jgi:hypothetical protein